MDRYKSARATCAAKLDAEIKLRLYRQKQRHQEELSAQLSRLDRDCRKANSRLVAERGKIIEELRRVRSVTPYLSRETDGSLEHDGRGGLPGIGLITSSSGQSTTAKQRGRERRPSTVTRLLPSDSRTGSVSISDDDTSSGHQSVTDTNRPLRIPEIVVSGRRTSSSASLQSGREDRSILLLAPRAIDKLQGKEVLAIPDVQRFRFKAGGDFENTGTLPRVSPTRNNNSRPRAFSFGSTLCDSPPHTNFSSGYPPRGSLPKKRSSMACCDDVTNNTMTSSDSTSASDDETMQPRILLPRKERLRLRKANILCESLGNVSRSRPTTRRLSVTDNKQMETNDQISETNDAEYVNPLTCFYLRVPETKYTRHFYQPK